MHKLVLYGQELHAAQVRKRVCVKSSAHLAENHSDGKKSSQISSG